MPDEVVKHAQELAQALMGRESKDARARTVTLRIVAARAQCQQLDVLLGKAIAGQDLKLAVTLNAVLSGAQKRMMKAIEQLARESQPRTVVIAANTANVMVK